MQCQFSKKKLSKSCFWWILLWMVFQIRVKDLDQQDIDDNSQISSEYFLFFIFYSFQQHLQNLLPPHDRNWTGQQVLTYEPNLSLILIKSCFTEVLHTSRVLQTAYLFLKNLYKYLCSAAVTNSSIYLQKKTGESRVCQLKHILYLHVVLS